MFYSLSVVVRVMQCRIANTLLDALSISYSRLGDFESVAQISVAHDESCVAPRLYYLLEYFGRIDHQRKVTSALE